MHKCKKKKGGRKNPRKHSILLSVIKRLVYIAHRLTAAWPGWDCDLHRAPSQDHTGFGGVGGTGRGGAGEGSWSGREWRNCAVTGN